MALPWRNGTAMALLHCYGAMALPQRYTLALLLPYGTAKARWLPWHHGNAIVSCFSSLVLRIYCSPPFTIGF